MTRTAPQRHSHMQFFKLCEAVKAFRDQFNAEKLTDARAAEVLAKHLGFPVSDEQVSRARQATGLSWARKPHQPPIHKNTVRKNQLAQAVTHLFQRLGEPLPPFLQPFAQDTQPMSNGHVTLASAKEMVCESK